MFHASNDFRACFATAVTNWTDGTPWSMLADTVRDQSVPEHVALEAQFPLQVMRVYDVHSFPSGSGSGRGVGIGRGVGKLPQET